MEGTRESRVQSVFIVGPLAPCRLVEMHMLKRYVGHRTHERRNKVDSVEVQYSDDLGKVADPYPLDWTVCWFEDGHSLALNLTCPSHKGLQTNAVVSATVFDFIGISSVIPCTWADIHR